MNIARFTAAASLILILSSVVCYGLEPHEILVLANRNAKGSVGVAKYYMEKRKIPESHLLQLWVTDGEYCSREDFEKKIVPPLRRLLAEDEFKRKVRCLVLFYGLPLRVEPPEPGAEEKLRKAELEKRRSSLLENFKAAGESPAAQELKREIDLMEREIVSLSHRDQGASLDSELALVLAGEYPLAKWVTNPLFLGNQGRYVKSMPDKGEVLMVSRLDGPDVGVVRRMIDEALRAEDEGMKGVAYFDARWPKPQDPQKRPEGMSYEFYDRSIHAAAEAVRKSGRMAVVVNDREELFKPGECPDAALYCGWYSLARYVDAFDWVPGAVGYHIASGECSTLKQAGSQAWCKRMLEDGVAATLGPVTEPYVQAFPVPELFFSLLLEGYWTLAECYALSQPFWSWQMVLLGDPLYRPFTRFRNSARPLAANPLGR